MNNLEKSNFATYRQKLLFKSTENIPPKENNPYKCLAQMYSATLLLSSKENTLKVLKQNLRECDPFTRNNMSCFPNCSSEKSKEYQSNIGVADFSAIEDLSNREAFSSQTATNRFNSFFQNRLNENVRPPTTSLHSCSPGSKQIQPVPLNSKVDTYRAPVNVKQAEQGLPNTFRTALEEMDLQNLKKFGGKSMSQSQLGQKRKLDMRKPYKNKFVSPLLTKTESSDSLPKSQETSNKIEDDRLKNIDSKMVELICSEIMDSGSSINWDDIAGLEFAKNSIKEAVVLPILRPDIFTGLRQPPKGILLFGPPGTGKTLIGKCIASQSKSTFFCISASSLTSKWIGDGEKMVKALFAVARCYQPAVIFIDEVDSLLSQRNESEHESSRRIKTEFLVQLDGAATSSNERILLVGATNRPQELDEAARRRFVKRLYIPLPDYQARLQLVVKLMSSERHDLSDEDFGEIARLSEGYSGADMKNLCSEASLGPIRCININLLQSIQLAEVRAINMSDFVMAFTRVKTSVAPEDLNQYLIWNKTYGSGDAF